MPYLINCDTFGCVYFQAVIGLAENKQEILELLYNYYNLSKNLNNYSFEGDYNNLDIFIISNDNYIYLKSIYNDHEEIIDEHRKSYWFKGTVENVMTSFWGLILYTDADKPAKNIIDDPLFYSKYKNILKTSPKLIL